MRQPCYWKPERLTALRLLIFLPAACAVLSSCAREAGPPPSIVLVDPSAIEIRDVPRDAHFSVRATVTVGEEPTGDPPVAGSVRVVNDVPTFLPMFPLEPGRAYLVRAEWRGARAQDVVRVPPKAAGDPVRITAVHPALEGIPENVLRLYIHFSGSMGGGVGPDHVRIVGAEGREVVDPFLPVAGEFWNADHTRFTLFFDPGRVKTGILPNERMGRPLQRGKRYVLIIDGTWKDASGRPLADGRTYSFTPGPAITAALDPYAWPIAAPRAGSRDPFLVRFPHALDHALLQRALAIEAGGRPVDGAFEVPAGEREWRFIPAQPWAAVPHDLVVLSILEDPSGNRIGRAFESEGATRGPAASDRVLIPWSPVR